MSLTSSITLAAFSSSASISDARARVSRVSSAQTHTTPCQRGWRSKADERKAEAGLVTGDAHELLEGVVAVELHHQLLLQVLAEPIHKHVHLPTRDKQASAA